MSNRDKIAENILSTGKYRMLCRDTVIDILYAEKNKYDSRKQLVKAVRRRLHQIKGAFAGDRAYKNAKTILDKMDEESAADIKDAINEIIRYHASTYERMPVMDEFYKKVFDALGSVESVLDIGCGFNPFTNIYIPGFRDIKYTAIDIDGMAISLIDRYFKITGIDGCAYIGDALISPIGYNANVAFLFKLLPLLEQREKGGSIRLLDNLNTAKMVVTYPAASLSGRGKGMIKNYSQSFEKMTEDRYSILLKEIIGRELVYIIERK